MADQVAPHPTFSTSQEFWQWWNGIMLEGGKGWEQPKAIVDEAGLYWYAHIPYNHTLRMTLENRRKIMEAAIKLGYFTAS